ncbi:hypothetical protein H8356DRAFT_1376225 [Neocallimastix lanati (nom. inval.)]|nr:hypothetical protein H8356DRAFT_1376225 [Neocallimastix sp. JGI-2020a]
MFADGTFYIATIFGYQVFIIRSAIKYYNNIIVIPKILHYDFEKGISNTCTYGYPSPIWPYIIGILRRSQSSLHTARRCIPNVPTYISIDHEHQNGTINSSLVGVIIGDWKFYNHQGLCFNSKRSIRVG